MTTSLVTGANGFIGRHLVNFLISRGDRVIELVNASSRDDAAPFHLANLGFKMPNENRHRVAVDILDSDKIKALVSKFRPDEIYHLAGQSSPNISWLQPAETMRVNYEGSLNIIQGVIEAELKPALVMASSSSIYAENKVSLAIDEEGKCNPSTPYGISKLAVDCLAKIYSKAYGMRIFNARPFFLIGAMKVGDVFSDWAKNIVDIERGRCQELSIGQINGVKRDFLSIHDGVRGMALIASKGLAGESYNICSGSGIALSDVLNMFINASPNSIKVSIDGSKIRPVEELIKVGDNTKLRSLGWNQEIGIESALKEILEYWRSQ